MEIKFVQLKSDLFVPYTLRKVSESETLVQFWVPSLYLQQMHNSRFHCNYVNSPWYRDKPRNIGIQHKFHQAGFDSTKEFDFSNEPAFLGSSPKDQLEFFRKYIPAYNRVELFGNNITQETVERYLFTYLTK